MWLCIQQYGLMLSIHGSMMCIMPASVWFNAVYQDYLLQCIAQCFAPGIIKAQYNVVPCCEGLNLWPDVLHQAGNIMAQTYASCMDQYG